MGWGNDHNGDPYSVDGATGRELSKGEMNVKDFLGRACSVIP